MKSTIRIRLLGPVHVERDGAPPLRFGSRKALALLAYLVTRRRPIPRSRLADLFWGDQAEQRGRANLSWVLNRINSVLPGSLGTTWHTVTFRPGTGCWVDMDVFEELEAQHNPTALTEAVGLFRGEFLEALDLRGCSEFEIWLEAERERWRLRLALALTDLVAYHAKQGAVREGIRFARRLLALEPWREESHRQMMRLLAQAGERSAALAQYETCRCMLTKELGVEPERATVDLYERIRDGQLQAVEPNSDQPGYLGGAALAFLAPDEAGEAPVFVAREQELARLECFLDGALEGQGRVVFVTGDPGSGKTALVRTFARRQQSVHTGLMVASGNGNAQSGVGDPYLPFREVLGLLTGDVATRWAAAAMTQEQARRLWQFLPCAAQVLMEHGPDLINTFVSGPALLQRLRDRLPRGADWLAPLEQTVLHRIDAHHNPNLVQSGLFEQYTRAVQALAAEYPLLIILDDAQWMDAGSASLLFHLGKRLDGCRVLIIAAHRPSELTPDRDGQRHPMAPVINELEGLYGEIEVNLDRADDRGFVEAYLETEPNRLGALFCQRLHQQTRGHPLFTIELLRGMQERGDLVQDPEGRWVEGLRLDWETLPPRVEAVIAERIGRLDKPLRRALEVASVEGEVFSAEIVAQVLTLDTLQMIDCLSAELNKAHRLVWADGTTPVGDGFVSRYRFRHILHQKYVYNSLDPVERVNLHKAVGSALEEFYGEEAKGIAVQLARHFEVAGMLEKAVEYLNRAGEQALHLAANAEATVHFRRGLELLERLPDTPTRAAMELETVLNLSLSLQAIKGYGHPEVAQLNMRAWGLCRNVQGIALRLPVLWYLSGLFIAHGKYDVASEIGQEMLDLTADDADPVRQAVSQLAVGWTVVYKGALRRAQEHLERAVALCDASPRELVVFPHGPDIRVSARFILYLTLGLLGYPDQALQKVSEGLALAEELSDPLSLVLANGWASLFSTLRGDLSLVERSAERCIQLAVQGGFLPWLGIGRFCKGWVLARRGGIDEGLALMHQALDDIPKVGIVAGDTMRLTLLAETYALAGRPRRGLRLLADALAAVECTGERFWEAEIHRLNGELLQLQGGDDAKIECHYQQAVSIASEQGARFWELRAVMSLCHLWHRRGKTDAARARLAEIYRWFTEGFDMPDLRTAKALLQTL